MGMFFLKFDFLLLSEVKKNQRDNLVNLGFVPNW